MAFVVVDVGCCHCCCVGDGNVRWIGWSGVRKRRGGVPTQGVTEGIQYQKYAQKLGYELKSTHKSWVMSLKYAQYAQKVVCTNLVSGGKAFDGG